MSGHGTAQPMTARKSGPLTGRAEVPGDKSISHRALIFGAMAVGETRVTGLLEGQDVLDTAKAMRAFGATVTRHALGEWSVQGVGVAYVLRLSLRPVSCRKTSVFHFTIPVAASKHNTRHDRPSSVAVVTKTSSPHTIGEECPSPGIAAFHLTPSVSDHRDGNTLVNASPWRLGPRKQGQ